MFNHYAGKVSIFYGYGRILATFCAFSVSFFRKQKLFEAEIVNKRSKLNNFAIDLSFNSQIQ